MTTLTGILFLHSETGTEGGWWALQDDKFITPPAEEPSVKICATCSRYWNVVEQDEEPAPSFTYYQPEREENGTKYAGGYHASSEPIEGGQTTFGDEEEGSFNDKWTRASNEASLKCYEGGHMWEWQQPTEKWSYEGLVYIKNGDVLEIFDPQNEDEVIDTITVKLLSNGDQYREGADHARGFIIHEFPDPESIDREKWEQYFFESFHVRLTRSE